MDITGNVTCFLFSEVLNLSPVSDLDVPESTTSNRTRPRPGSGRFCLSTGVFSLIIFVSFSYCVLCSQLTGLCDYNEMIFCVLKTVSLFVEKN